MDGRLQPRTIASVREQRSLNKVFGLAEPDKWSGGKQLIDFIEELIDPKKPARHKIEKRFNHADYHKHLFVAARESWGQRSLLPFVTLVSLECAPIWLAGKSLPSEEGEEIPGREPPN
ncbi:MAG: hypothetical protein M1821_007791 [Bathelium mastoideum]|nr:MAG: hypothetical protein M1821_007791 [Bathelium mastoideum]